MDIDDIFEEKENKIFIQRMIKFREEFMKEINGSQFLLNQQ